MIEELKVLANKQDVPSSPLRSRTAEGTVHVSVIHVAAPAYQPADRVHGESTSEEQCIDR